MGLLDGVMGMLGGGAGNEAISGIAGQLGLDPAMAQNLMGSLAGNLGNGQSPQDAIAAAAQEHGVDPSVVGQLHDAVAGGGAGGAMGGLGGMLGGMLGGGSDNS